MKKALKVLIILAAIAIYLNIGWAYGTYSYNHLQHAHLGQPTLAQKILTGPNRIMAVSATNTLLFVQTLSEFLWPMLLALPLGAWAIYGIYLLLWLIFAGGIAKTIGPHQMIVGALLAAVFCFLLYRMSRH